MSVHTYTCQSCNYVAVNGPDLMTHTSMAHGNFFMAAYNSQYYTQQLFYGSHGQTNSVPPNTPRQPPIAPLAASRGGSTSSLTEGNSGLLLGNPDEVAKYDCESCGKKFRHKGNMQRYHSYITYALAKKLNFAK